MAMRERLFSAYLKNRVQGRHITAFGYEGDRAGLTEAYSPR